MNKPMKYIILFSFVFILQTSITAQSKVVLGEEEIRKSPYTKFENRSDQFATPTRKAMEVEIGKGLHSLVSETDKPINYKGFTLQRFYSDEPGKFGGDILVLNKNASYGHINSIKRILNAYIQTSFEYTEKNADKLVMEVLYYNAQNRQKLDRIKKRYTKSLVAALSKNKVGIGKKFSDWPGNTQIVIPIKSQAAPKTEDTVEKKSDNKNEKSTTTDKTPVNEKEKIKITKEKIPSTDMSKENITNTSKTSNEKKSTPSDEPIIKEEKKVIEIRNKETSKDTISAKESEMKQPEKNKTTTSSESKTTANSDKPEDNKDTVDESKVDKKNENTNKDEKKTVTDKPNDSKKEVVIKEEIKKVSEETTPTKTSKDQNKKVEESKTAKDVKTETGKDNSKKNSEQIPPAKTTTDQSKKIEENKSVKELKTETSKDESKKSTDQTPPTKVVTDKNKIEDKKTTNEPKETPKKEEKVVEVVTKKTNSETAKETKSEEKTVTVKDTSKTVALNETKTVTTDKPVAKEVKTIEPPKKAEEPKKEVPKKETVSNPPAKVVEDKIPVTKTEIKKMHKELVELKAKEKDKTENSENVVGEKIVFLKVKEFLAEGHYTSEMWAVDTENDDELFQSPFKKVCGKEFKELDTGVVVMSFKDNDILKTDTHHLALLDKDNLKLIKQSQEIIFWRSFIKEQSGKIYAIEFKDGKYYLAQFKNDLTFEMRSSDPINPDCEIAFKKNKIYLTKRAGAESSEVSIRVLNRDNLKLRDVKLVK